MRISATPLSLLLALTVVACGGGGGTEDEGTMEADTTAVTETDPALRHPAAGAVTAPSWMQVDATAKTVTMDIKAGESNINNHWNYNGLYAESGAIVVPEGYQVTINFTNSDPTQPHSLGISEKMDAYPALFENPTPSFEGAITPDAGTTGTPPGGTATVSFTTGAAGDYAMVCYIAGHAVAGMVVPFTVSADGSVGVQQ
jgi:FtsP/CotA-like multicopper oxidase with cupredoxin domain